MIKSSNEKAEQVERAFAVASHVHSKWSYDGRWTLKELATEFRRRGYRAVLMTEHDRGFTETKWTEYRAACAEASSSDLLLIPGIEYSDPENVVHVLVWGAGSFLSESVATLTLLGQAREQAAVAVMAHPSRLEAWRCFKSTWIDGLSGIERWNRKTDGWAPSRTAPALLSQSSLMSFAGLDFHDRRQFFPLSMQVSLDGEVTEATILKALRNGKAVPCIFGRPLTTMLNPAGTFVFSTAERVRRPLARSARRVLRSVKACPTAFARQAA